MPDIPHIPLREFFRLFAPTYVLGTTYTISLAFFEGLVFPEINRTHLRRCLLLCDKVGFQRATVEASAVRSAAREYMALVAPAPSSFHPKVWLIVGDDRAAVLVGSGNLTQSGFMDNLELFDVVQLEARGPHKSVALDLAQFLAGLRSMWSGLDGRQLLALDTLDEMRRALVALAERMPDEPPMPDLRFMHSFAAPLANQLAALGPQRALSVAAPYFGGSTAGLQLLLDRLPADRVNVFPAVHRGMELDVSLGDLSALPHVTVQPLLVPREDAFAHLKIYGFASDDRHWLFTTSANCTVAALAGGNVEAGLLRRVEPTVLDRYFTPASSKTLPTAVRNDPLQHGDSWLPFWASDRGDAIELVSNPGPALPLHDVRVMVRAGDASRSTQLPGLFAQRNVDRLAWSLFPLPRDRSTKPALLSIRAVSAHGLAVYGESLIDHPLLLSSEPGHRSAWRAALALLEGEGLPESADLASIFHLVQGVFDTPAPHSTASGFGAEPATPRERAVLNDRLAIWPPISDGDVFGTVAGTAQIHDLRWFQKILAEFLNPLRAGHEPGPVTTDDETGEGRQEVRLPPRLTQSLWRQAATSFEQLQTRLHSMQATRELAPKIWPVATAVFLLAMIVRRRLRRHGDATVELATPFHFIRDFVRLLFVEREQPEDFIPPYGSRYTSPIYPALAPDLAETFDVRPSDDLADIALVVFAAWQAEEARVQRSAPINPWLCFRDLAPNVVARATHDRSVLRDIFNTYVADDIEGITWSEIDAALDVLLRTTWRDQEGFKLLAAIIAQAKAGNGTSLDALPPSLRDAWSQTERRIRLGKKWAYAIDPFDDCCVADGCPMQNRTDPKKRIVRSLQPTICSACGAVLIPDRLQKAYQANT